MADTIYRLTNSNDTVDSISNTEKIVFNTGTVPDETGKLTQTSFRMTTDLNAHPNPSKNLNPIQDSLLGVLEVTIAGYFTSHNTTMGPANIFKWAIGTKKNTIFRNGRFGLVLSSFNELLSLVPGTGTDGTGYVLGDVYVNDVPSPRDKVEFILKLYRQGVINE